MILRLKRPHGPWLAHDVEPRSGRDTISLNSPADIEFTLPPEWHDEVASDGHPVLLKGGTLVVLEGDGETRVGIVDDIVLEEDHVRVMAGGFSMLAKDTPWEGPERRLVSEDPVQVFRDIWTQIQAHSLADLGITITGDERSGGTSGKPATPAWLAARRDVNQYLPQVNIWEGRMLTRERLLDQRAAELTRMASLKRVGTITDTENEPPDPTFRADSTVWIKQSTGRAYVWRDTRWVSQSQADDAVVRWREAKNSQEVGARYLDAARYRLQPAQEKLDELTDKGEGEETFDLNFYSVLDLSSTIQTLSRLGPFDWVERSRVNGERLDLSLEVSAPRRERRRPEVWVELGENVHEMPVLESGEAITDVLVFGAGHGSKTPRAHLTIPAGPRVRRFRTATDSDAYTKALLNSSASSLRNQVERESRKGFTRLLVTDTPQSPLRGFQLGDVLWVRGAFSDDTQVHRWVRVTGITREWGQGALELEVEAA